MSWILRKSSRASLLELAHLISGRGGINPRNNYAGCLQALHGAMKESQQLINWEELIVSGLPNGTERQNRLLDLEVELRELGSPPTHESYRDPPAIFPTLGVSLGSLFAWEMGGRLAKRLARTIVESLPDLGPEQGVFVRSYCGQSPRQWSSFQDWVDGCELTEDGKEESVFSVLATLQFMKRNLKCVIANPHSGRE